MRIRVDYGDGDVQEGEVESVTILLIDEVAVVHPQTYELTITTQETHAA